MYFLYFVIFIFGLIVGSFLNCVIYRLETGGNFLKGRSFCPSCKHDLGFFDLVPVLSFIFLKRKCRYCQKLISWQYPLVELATGILFLIIFNFYSLNFSQYLIFAFQNLFVITYSLLISSFLLIIFIFDLKHYIIPDKVIFPAIIISLLYNSLFNWFYGSMDLWLNSFYSALGAAGFFLAIVLISRGRWMGIGDIKLGFFMGLFLGWPNILVALFLAFFIGAVIGVGLIGFGKKKFKSEVPFGPFLVLGTFLALFWGEKLIDWYLNLFF